MSVFSISFANISNILLFFLLCHRGVLGVDRGQHLYSHIEEVKFGDKYLQYFDMSYINQKSVTVNRQFTVLFVKDSQLMDQKHYFLKDNSDN